jgi:GAF domain-containing protein
MLDPGSMTSGLPPVQTEDPVAMVENLVRLAAQSAGSTSASFFKLDGPSLHPWYVYGLPPEYVAACGPVPVGEQCCGRAVAFRKPWVVSDMLTDPDWVHMRSEIEKTEIRAAFSVPLMRNGSCIGSLACHFKKPYQPSSEAIMRNETFATLIAFAFKRFADELERNSRYSAPA